MLTQRIVRPFEPGGILIALIVSVVALCAAQPVLGQFTHNSVRITAPDPTGYIILHSFETFREPVGGNFAWSPGGRLGVEIGPNGGAFAGRHILTAPQPEGTDHEHFTSVLDVIIDDDGALGLNPPIAHSGGNAWEQHENTNALADAPSPASLDFLVTEPWHVIPPRTIEGEWQIPVDQASNLTALEWVTVRERYTVLRDTVRVELIITNNTNRGGAAGRSLAIGVRLFFDTTFGGTVADAQPIFSSDPSPAFSDEVGFDDDPATSAPDVPDAWMAFELGRPSDTTGLSLKGTLKGGEVDTPGGASGAAGPPDRVGIGPASRMNSPFDDTPFAPLAIPFIGQDWGVEVFWEVPNVADLPQGRSRRYVTYIGLGNATSDFAPPYVLALESPLELIVVRGDDPSTPGTIEEFFYTSDISTGQPTGISRVAGFANNTGIVTMPNVNLTLSVPPDSGIVFTDAAGNELPGMTRAIAVGDVLANSEGRASLHIRVQPGTRPGVYPIRLVGPNGKMVERLLTVPALPSLSPDILNPLAPITMISIPYQFQNADAENVLQSLAPLGSALASVARWDPAVSQYRFFPDPFTTTLLPGRAFWLINRALTQINLPDEPDRSDVPVATSFMLNLQRGWNQIGTPFTGPTFWSTTEFLVDGEVKSFQEALGARIILPTLYSYNEDTRQYEFTDNVAQMRLDPFRGYWVHVFRDVVALIHPPSPAVGRSVPARAGAGRGSIPQKGTGDWEVELRAAVGDLSRTGRILGVRGGAADGYGLEDVMSPPPPRSPQGHLDIAFVHDDWDVASGRYLRDLRSPARAAHVWDVMVESDRANETIVIAWPNLAEVPKDVQLTLRDIDTGAVRLMRTAGSYSFSPGQAGAQRHLQVVAGPAPGGDLRIDAITYVPGRGSQGSLEFRVSAAAVVDVAVLNVTGRRVRTVVVGKAMGVGRNAVVWDGRSDSGTAAPDGIYIAKITARTADRAQCTATHVFSRLSR